MAAAQPPMHFPTFPQLQVLEGNQLDFQLAIQNKSDPETLKLIHHQLVFLLRAHKCERQGLQGNGEVRCSLPQCKALKNILNHIKTCRAGGSCSVTHCYSCSQIISHWKYCYRNDCSFCSPIKKVLENRNHANAPNNPPQPMQFPNPSVLDMRRGYDAMRRQWPTTETQAQQKAVDNVELGRFQLRGLQSSQVKAIPMQSTKEWHRSISQDLRNHLVHELVQAIIPTADSQAMQDKRMRSLVVYARKVESNMYEKAYSYSEYYFSLADKIHNIQKELVQKMQKRSEEMLHQQAAIQHQLQSDLNFLRSNFF